MVEKSVCTEVEVKDFVGVEEEVKDLDPTEDREVDGNCTSAFAAAA